MPTARSLVAALALAFAAISCSDQEPTSNTPTEQQPTEINPQVANGPLVIPLNTAQNSPQTFTNSVTGATATITQVTITELTRVDNRLLASGTVSGTSNVPGSETFTRTFTDVPIEITQQGRRCQILHLDLGPLFLDLLGLQIDLSVIILDITAVQGAGNLLGNLLCALVGLLDGPNLTALDQVLAQINAILGG